MWNSEWNGAQKILYGKGNAQSELTRQCYGMFIFGTMTNGGVLLGGV